MQKFAQLGPPQLVLFTRYGDVYQMNEYDKTWAGHVERMVASLKEGNYSKDLEEGGTMILGGAGGTLR
jgi:hypothetical protein